MNKAIDNLKQFVINYSTPMEIQNFEQSKILTDQNTIEALKQAIYYNSQTNSFEQVQEEFGKSL